MAYVVHTECVGCGAPPNKTCIMIGPPARKDPIWLCWDCYLVTPSGVALLQQQLNKTLGDIDGLQTEQAVADDQPRDGGDPGPHVQGA